MVDNGLQNSKVGVGAGVSEASVGDGVTGTPVGEVGAGTKDGLQFINKQDTFHKTRS